MTQYFFRESENYTHKELALTFLGCAIAFAGAWILYRWRITPSPAEIWATLIFRDTYLFWALGFAASGVVACAAAENRRETLIIALLLLSAAVMAFWIQRSVQPEHMATFVVAKFCGVLGISVLAFQARRPGGLTRLLIVICFSLFVPISASYLYLTSFVRPNVMDFHAYAYDLSLGVPIAPYFYVLYHRSWSVAGFSTAAYVSLVASYEILFALQMRFRDESVVPSLRLFLLAAVFGFLAYFLFPVAGPIYFFREDYPGHLPPFANLAIKMFPAYPSFRNGMPSLHFAWALLLVINVPRGLRYVRAAFSVFCLLTGIAALGMGEHYLVDLIAAIPFAGMIQALGLTANGGRWHAHAYSALRCAAVFAAFLLLVAGSPSWLHEPIAAWLVTVALVLHLTLELRWQRIVAASIDSRSSGVPMTAS